MTHQVLPCRELVLKKQKKALKPKSNSLILKKIFTQVLHKNHLHPHHQMKVRHYKVIIHC